MRKFLRASLSSHGYRLVEATNGAEGLTQAAAYNPDLILLDLGLPDIDGLDVTKRLREWASAPIIVISARGQEDDKINALDAGADDYLTKPFGTGELLARIRVALRHSARSRQERSEPMLTVGDLSVDLDKRSVRGGKEVHLTPIEYKLLGDSAEKRWKSADASPAAEGGVGAGLREQHPIPAGVHGAAPAQARGGRHATAVFGDRAGRRLSA